MVTKVNNRMVDGAATNLIDFGAVGDGVTDDAPALQKALETNQRVIVPAGTYLLASPINVTVDKVDVVGQGRAVFLIGGSKNINDEGVFSGVTETKVLSVSAPEVYFTGLIFDGDNSWAWGCLEIANVTNYAKVEGCEFKDFRYLRLDQDVRNLSSAIRFSNCENYVARGCKFTNVYYQTLNSEILTNATVTNGEKLGRAIDNGGTNINGLYELCTFFQTRTTTVMTASYGHVTQCSFDTWTDNAIYDLGGSGSKYTFNAFNNSDDEGIVTRGVNKFIIGNNFYNVSNKCIALNGNCDRYTIAQNTFRAQNPSALSAIVQRTEYNNASYKTTNFNINNNVFIAQEAGYSIIYLFHSENIKINNNSFMIDNEYSSGTAYYIKINTAETLCDLVVTDNFVSTPSSGAINFLEASTNVTCYEFGNYTPQAFDNNVVNPAEAAPFEDIQVNSPSGVINLDGASVELLDETTKGAIHLYDTTNFQGTKPGQGLLITGEGDDSDFSQDNRRHIGAFGLVFSNSEHSDNDTSFVVYTANNATQTVRKVLAVDEDGNIECFLWGAGLRMRSPDGTLYELSPPNGGGAATWVAI